MDKTDQLVKEELKKLFYAGIKYYHELQTDQTNETKDVAFEKYYQSYIIQKY